MTTVLICRAQNMLRRTSFVYAQAMSFRSAFSLVELLVVVSIIAMLSAILLPAISRVKQGARTVQCLGNLRQIGCGLQGYATDHQGFYPKREMLNEVGLQIDWSTWIAPYIETDRSGTQSRGSASGRILKCRNYPTWGVAQSGTNAGYALNFYLANRQSGIRVSSTAVQVSERTNDNGFGAPKELDYARHPGNGHRNYSYLWPGDQYGDLVTIPVTQRVCALFADGHVQAINKAQAWTCMKWKVAGGDL